jgi:hypothetical protein
MFGRFPAGNKSFRAAVNHPEVNRIGAKAQAALALQSLSG